MSGRVGPWLLGGAVVVAAVFALLSGSNTPSQLGRGSPAPPFELARVGAQGSVSLADLQGKVVLLNFWATWCKPCEDEMPAMERLYRELSGQDFELVAISVDEEPAVVESFRERLGLTFPVLLDPAQDVAAAYQTFRFPESLLVGRDGVVIERYVGAKEWDAEAYVNRIERLLSETAPG